MEMLYWYSRVAMFAVLAAWGLTCLFSATPWWFDLIAVPTWTLVLTDVVIRSRQRMGLAAAQLGRA